MKIGIIGANVSAVTAAREIRKLAADAVITLYTEESCPYYPRPKLIDLLAGSITEEALFFYPESWYADNRIELVTSARVAKIDAAKKEVVRADGSRRTFDVLILAAGASANMIPALGGVGKDWVFCVRTLDDVKAIKARIASSSRALVVGGGLLGLESARGLLGAGLGDVTVLEYGPTLLPRQIDAEGSPHLVRLLGEKVGIKVRFNIASSAILPDRAGLALKDGSTVPGDLIVIAAGVIPNISLAKDAGLAVNRGIVVDEHMMTSAEGVYAIGDCAEFNGRTYGYIPACLDHAKVAAARIAGDDSARYADSIPSNTLHIGEIDLTTLGSIAIGEGIETVTRIDEMAGRYYKLFISQGAAVGAILLGDKRIAPRIATLVRSKTDVTSVKDRLFDDDFKIA